MQYIHTTEYNFMKEQITDTCNTAEPQNMMINERSQIQNLSSAWFHVYEISRKGKTIKTKSRLVIAWG